MVAGSFTVPTQFFAVGGDNEDNGIDIVVQSAEEAALAEEQARIDDNEDNSELEMENEGNNGDHDDHDSDNGEEMDDIIQRCKIDSNNKIRI